MQAKKVEGGLFAFLLFVISLQGSGAHFKLEPDNKKKKNAVIASYISLIRSKSRVMPPHLHPNNRRRPARAHNLQRRFPAICS